MVFFFAITEKQTSQGMEQTRAEVLAHLPRVLADLAIIHVVAGVEEGRKNVARAGQYETCMKFRHFEDKDWCFREACRGGHIHIARAMLLRTVDLRHGFVAACRGGHARIVLWLMFLRRSRHEGPTKLARLKLEQENWEIMKDVCGAGNMAIVDLLVAKRWNLWNRGLQAACIAGQRAIALRMLEHGATNARFLLDDAAEGGDPIIVRTLLEHGATGIESALNTARNNGRVEAEKILLAFRGSH
jgi:hypothetical protein